MEPWLKPMHSTALCSCVKMNFWAKYSILGKVSWKSIFHLPKILLKSIWKILR